MLREVTLLEKLRHPNIIEYKHAWVEEHQPTPFGPSVPTLFILMEQANGGNLEEYIDIQWKETESSNNTKKKNRKVERLLTMNEEANSFYPNEACMRVEGGIGYNEEGLRKVRYLNVTEIWSFFVDICKGLKHLHKHGIS